MGSDTKILAGIFVYWLVFGLFLLFYSMNPVADNIGQDIILTDTNQSFLNVSEQGAGNDIEPIQAGLQFLQLIGNLLTFRLISGNLVLNILLSGFNYLLITITIILGVRLIRGVS